MSNTDIFDAAGVAAQVTEADIQAVAAIKSLFDLPAFDETTALLAACKGKVLVTGSGTSGSVARRAAHLLSVSGTPAFFLSPGDGLHGGLGALTADDIILAFSKGGSSLELNDFLPARTNAGQSSGGHHGRPCLGAEPDGGYRAIHSAGERLRSGGGESSLPVAQWRFQR
ncbi:SIS domain-containing protein [Acerihabitans sp. KWT182]|uniref:SIS domain-containing protein n=1 Tax=Acerihabitans sp. KWT182 TaxID=3157919 RepID=A0AAU7QF33_9GAMM